MKVIILAAGQGTRLRPLTDDRPKCMVEVNGRALIDRLLATLDSCGADKKDISIVVGYRADALRTHLKDTGITIIDNEEYDATNMVCSLMCAREVMAAADDVVVSYGDIIYGPNIFNKLLASEHDISVITDDGWYDYWKLRCDDPLADAESLKKDADGYIVEIGQKTKDIEDVQSQYIGLMRFKGDGLAAMLATADEAKRRSANGEGLWRTTRNYSKMYMTDLLQGMIDEGHKLKAVPIRRGWFEIDDLDDLEIAEMGADEA